MDKLISEIMEKDVYYSHIDDTIGHVLELFIEKKISGVPIVNNQKEVVGFISDGDIMKYIGKQKPKSIDAYSYMFLLYDEKSFEQKIQDLINLNVMRLATTKVVAVKADKPIDEVATILGNKKIKKAPVIDQGKLVGVISRSEITRYIAASYLKKAIDKNKDEQ